MFQRYKLYPLFSLVSIFTFCSQPLSHNLSFVFKNQRSEIASFIDNVLRQLPSDSVLELIDGIHQESKAPTDAQLYEQLCIKLQPLKSRFDTLKIIKLINFQKELLQKQIEALLGTTQINNCLEIGTPGTYASTIKNRIKGNMYAITEQQRFTDFLQARSLNPLNGFKGYHTHLALNNYQPISAEIPDNSLDLIICTIGLHHCTPNLLEAFIDSIKRVLRPGGIFLLREHNAHSPELVSLAYAAHSVYNAIIPEESVAAEMSEIRNFHSLNYWKELLECHGFVVSPEEYLQEGDTTLNTFFKCTKKCMSMDDQVVNASCRAQQYPDYQRSSEQTYLTTPEWNNVDAAQHYSDYITKIPFYEFPYMAHVQTFWKTFAASWRCAAQEKGGNLKMLLSPNVVFNYALMNVFVGTFMTVEYAAKALVSWPIRKMLSGVEATTLLALLHDPCDELPQIDPTIVIKETYDGSLKLVAIPRYMQFLHTVKKLMNSSISFIKIANNEHIVCKVRYKNEPHFSTSTWEQKFTWTMPTIPEYTYAAYRVPVKELKEFIKTLNHKGGELLYIHDF